MARTIDMIALRPGSTADLTAITAIMQAAFDARYGEAWTASQCTGVMAMPGVWLTVAEIDGAAGGFALSRVIADEAELLLLAVKPECRRRGLGRALLRSAIAESQARGAARIHLEVRAGNDAVALYRLAGFEKVGQRRDYYRGINGKLFDAITYRKLIG
jgi:ribosomal-protein-alanine N-acetyltransferase